MSKADLHIHTTASDGLLEPKQVISEALRLQLSSVAITDHDTIEGVLEAQKYIPDDHFTLLSGVEFTACFGNRECHLLAYDFRLEAQGLQELLIHNKYTRLQRAEWIIDQLRQQGLRLDIDEVKAEANGLNVGRPHIAQILQKKGYVNSKRSAFIRYLSDEKLGTIKSSYRDYRQVIEIVKNAGGVIILAHPGRLYSLEECNEFIAAGIDGLEVRHPSHTHILQQDMEKLAQKHHLLTTGGSDFHGAKKDYYRHFGTMTVSQNQVHKLQALADQRKKVSV